MTGSGDCSLSRPSLLYIHGRDYYSKKSCHTIEGADRENSRLSKRPELRGRVIMATFPGWLLLQDPDERYLLWNHSTFESIILPPLKLAENYSIERYLMSTTDDNGSFTLFIFENTKPCIFVYRSGAGPLWKAIPYGKAIKDYYGQNSDDYPLHVTSPVCCNGNLYGLTHNGHRLVEIEIYTDDDDASRKYHGYLVIKSLECDMPKFIHSAPGYAELLVESNGEMLIIHFPVDGVKLMDFAGMDVYKFNLLNCKWEKLDSLDGADLFLEITGRSYVFKCIGAGGKGNRIYFTRFEEKYLYCYDMEDNSLLVSLPCRKLATPWDSPSWVLPITNRKGITEHTTTQSKESDNDFSDAFASSTAAAWLMIPGHKKGTWRFSDPTTVDTRYVMTAPEPLKKNKVRIECSKNGWLLLSLYEPRDTTFVFYNPFTKAMVHLPNLDDSDRYVGFAFSPLPTSEDCTVIAVERSDVISISRWCWGQTNWESFVFEDKVGFIANFNNPVFWKGSIFFLDQNGKLGALDGDKNYEWRAFDKLKKPVSYFRHCFLVECGGELVAVFIGYMGCSVNVFKLNLSKLIWEKVNSLGNYVLFFSRPSSFAVESSVGMENRIYFPRFYRERPVYYSLDTAKFHCVGTDETLLDYCGTKEHIECGWIHPPRSS